MIQNRNNVGIRHAFYDAEEQKELEMAEQVRDQLKQAMQARFDVLSKNL